MQGIAEINRHSRSPKMNNKKLVAVSVVLFLFYMFIATGFCEGDGKVTVEQWTEIIKHGGASNTSQWHPPDNSPPCSGTDAAWCGPCWDNKDVNNKWCCTHSEGKKLPDCIPEDHPERCQYCGGCNEGGKCSNFCTKPAHGAGGATNIRITNSTDRDIKIAFVTGAEGKEGACTDSNKMISYQWIADNTTWCKDPTHLGGGVNAGHCTGTVPKKGFVEVTRTGSEDAQKCLTGSIHLGGYSSCPPPTGFTQGEFTLNPTDTETEAVDISLVNGVSYALTINLPDEAWRVQDRGPMVRSIGPNEGLDGNNNKNGIFPPGCTDCIRLVGDLPCSGIPPILKCQDKRICNIYRAGATGGTVEFVISDLPK
jgi:hypothetical protein